MARAAATVGFRSRKKGSAPVAVSTRQTNTDSTLARPLTIGEVSRRSGFSVKSLRFYERRGILAASGRSPGGYRLYTEADLHRLEFIREAKALGLALDHIRELMMATRERSCRMTRPLLLRVLDGRIVQTSRQIETLRRLRETLQRRRRALVSRAPTDHRLGYCACLSEGSVLIPASGILAKPTGPHNATRRDQLRDEGE